MNEPKQTEEIKNDERTAEEVPQQRRPKFPKIKTRVKAGKPWRRY